MHGLDVIHAEVKEPSLKIRRRQAHREELDLVNEVKVLARVREETLKQKVAQRYNAECKVPRTICP